MRNLAPLAVSVMFMVMPTDVIASNVDSSDNWYRGSSAQISRMDHNPMFDGINLTEQQRQQMRDLIYLARRDLFNPNISEMRHMYQLITATHFDEVAVKQQAKKMSEEDIIKQVEIAKIRNQMYNLLTPEQKAQINQSYQQYFSQLQQQMMYLQNTSAQK